MTTYDPTNPDHLRIAGEAALAAWGDYADSIIEATLEVLADEGISATPETVWDLVALVTGLAHNPAVDTEDIVSEAMRRVLAFA